MKNQIERWLILPFSLGCASKSATSVCLKTLPSTCKEGNKSVGLKARGSVRVLSKQPSRLARGFHRLIQSLRSATQIFTYRDEEEEGEFEPEMEIGCPTNVKHLMHIGRDGSTFTPDSNNAFANAFKGWDDKPAPEVVSFPSVSLKQFEMAMNAQAHGCDSQCQAQELDGSKVVQERLDPSKAGGLS